MGMVRNGRDIFPSHLVFWKLAVPSNEVALIGNVTLDMFKGYQGLAALLVCRLCRWVYRSVIFCKQRKRSVGSSHQSMWHATDVFKICDAWLELNASSQKLVFSAKSHHFSIESIVLETIGERIKTAKVLFWRESSSFSIPSKLEAMISEPAKISIFSFYVNEFWKSLSNQNKDSKPPLIYDWRHEIFLVSSQ